MPESREEVRFPKTMYYCDPRKNTQCRGGRGCIVHGGQCFLTSRVECAETDKDGEPIAVMPREMLTMRMAAQLEHAARVIGRMPYMPVK